MELTIIGATGGIGHELVTQATASGHGVTAVARRANGLPAGFSRADVAHFMLRAIRQSDTIRQTVGIAY